MAIKEFPPADLMISAYFKQGQSSLESQNVPASFNVRKGKVGQVKVRS